MSQDKYIFIEVWSRLTTKKMGRQEKLVISRMLDPKEEKEDYQSEEMLKNIMDDKKQYTIERKERMHRKKKREKYYCNPKLMDYKGTDWFPQKGFSITREQIPHLIEGLQNIVKGDFDSYVNKVLFESGVIKKTLHKEIETETTQIDAEMEAEAVEMEAEAVAEIEEKEKQKKAEKYSSWLQALDKKLRKEAKNMEKEGWTPEEIQQAFRNKNR